MIDKLKLMVSDKRIIILLLLVGVFLMLLHNVKPISLSKENFSDSEYIDNLERRVESIVSAIYGAGKCEVMINILSSCESVYVKENKKSYDSTVDANKSESEDSVITMSDSDGNEHALMRKELMPEIGGVTVVCDGGNIESVKNNVIVAVSTVLGIGSNRVCVIAKAN